MPSTKVDLALQASATNTAGSTTTGSEFDVSDSYGVAVTATITNGATGPTVGCSVRVEVRNSGSGTWYTWASGTAGTANNGVYSFAWDIPPTIARLRVVFTGNTGQSVTVQADGSELTAI